MTTDRIPAAALAVFDRIYGEGAYVAEQFTDEEDGAEVIAVYERVTGRRPRHAAMFALERGTPPADVAAKWIDLASQLDSLADQRRREIAAGGDS